VTGKKYGTYFRALRTLRHKLKLWWSKSKISARFEAANPASFGNKLHATWPAGQPHVFIRHCGLHSHETQILAWKRNISNKTRNLFFRWPLHIFPLILSIFVYFFPWRNSPQWARAFIEASRSHSGTPHSVRLFWTSESHVAETSTWQHTTVTTDRHLCCRRDSNPQSQQASGRKPTPQATIRPN
jgi:hypothetical protein